MPLLLTLLAGLTGILYSGFAWADEDGTPGTPEPQTPAVSLNEVAYPEIPEEEKNIHKIIRQFLSKKDKINQRHRTGRKRLVKISLQKIALRALKQNLTIRSASLEEKASATVLQEAEAVFDPFLTLGFSYSESETTARSEIGEVFKKNIPPRDVISLQAPSKIKEIVFVDQRTEATVSETVFASESSTQGPPTIDTYSYKFSISQQLPWGSAFDITSTTTDKKTYYDSRGNTYDIPWATVLSMNLSFPLPFSKNFGPHSSFDVGKNLAEIEKEKTVWDIKATVNSVLLAVDDAYWNLVQAVKNLEATIQNRKIAEKLFNDTRQLYKIRRSTVYDLLQAETNLKGLKALEEETWQNYILVSNQITNLLNLKQGIVIFPSGYSQQLQENLEFDPDKALNTALHNRPELIAAQYNVESAQISYDFSDTQTRPDLSASLSQTLSQSNSTYGYESAPDALINVFRPDSRSMTQTLSYNYPYGNIPAEAAFAQAEASLDDQTLAYRELENFVEREIGTALSSIFSARTQIELTENNLKLAEEAYKNALILWEANRVNEFEIISKNRDLLNSELDKILNQINLKKSESRLLAAQGTLANHYPMIAMPGEFDQYRLKQLDANGNLRYFSSVKSGTP